MSPILTPILIGLGALLVGWVIGFFDSNLRTSKKIKEAEARAQAAVKEAQDKIAEVEARAALLPATESPNAETLLRLQKKDGNLVLELDGQQALASRLSAAEKKRLVGLLTLMRPWLDADAPQMDALRPSAPMPSAGTLHTPPAPAPVIAVVPAPDAKADAKKPAPPPQSIVEQIDSILQARMVKTPLAQKDVRLQESHEGGVVVMVGMQRYETVEDVPDPEIKTAIRAAIEEWEKKYTPGL